MIFCPKCGNFWKEDEIIVIRKQLQQGLVSLDGEFELYIEFEPCWYSATTDTYHCKECDYEIETDYDEIVDLFNYIHDTKMAIAKEKGWIGDISIEQESELEQLTEQHLRNNNK